MKTQMTGQPGESAKGFEIMVAEGKGLQVRGCVSRVMQAPLLATSNSDDDPYKPYITAFETKNPKF